MKTLKKMHVIFSLMLLLSCASANNPPAPFPQDTQMVRDDWPRQIVEGAVTFSGQPAAG